MTGLVETVVGDRHGKKRWREYRARVTALSEPYRTAAEALQRYLLRAGGVTQGDVLVEMHENLVSVLERADADCTPVGDVVGSDPVAFADGLLSTEPATGWIDGERRRLVSGITGAQARSSRP